jgi:hypothetical protein
MTGNSSNFDAWSEGVNYVRFDNLTSSTLNFDIGSPFFNKLGIGGIQVVGKSKVLSAFNTWQTLHFGDPNAATAAAGEDPDGDGITNLEEYALNGNPASADTSILPDLGEVQIVDERFLSIVVSKNPSATDVVYTAEMSTDLVQWDSGSGFTTVVSDTSETLVVRLNQSMVTLPKAFVRLRIDLVE